MRPRLFLTRQIAVAWLQQTAMAQARRKYGPGVRTSIGQSTEIRVLCNYTGIPEPSVRWGRRAEPGTPANAIHQPTYRR